MPSIIPRSASPPPQLPPIKKFHTLLGLGGVPSFEDEPDAGQGVGDGNSGMDGKKWLPQLHPAHASAQPSSSMNGPPSPSSAVRMHVNTEDGIWGVSAAESQQHAGAYTLYVKTPTHNLTLTRSVNEVRDLEAKLAEELPTATLPLSPLHPPPTPTSPASPTGGSTPTHTSRNQQPRKRSFLTTVSRLVSPSRNSSPWSTRRQHRHAPAHAPDLTQVANYLTTLSNEPRVRTARAWRRFVRVRVDDLESRRVERRVRRTRSDLAAHQGAKTGLGPMGVSGSRTAPLVGRGLRGMAEESEEEEDGWMGQLAEEKEKEEKEGMDGVVVDGKPDGKEVAKVDGDAAPAEHKAEEVVAPEPAPAPTEQRVPTPSPAPALSPPATPKVHAAHPTHLPDPIPTLLPRPASADPDTAARHHRMWKPSPAPTPLTHRPSETDITETTEDEEGGRESAAGGESATPDGAGGKKDGGKKKGKGKKVRIEDFEMMRVLGKGCAGKVLLVRHRASSTLYALKAITKRHVLAHQELQHTLTEQAVLKRMAAEARDPFVVRLYWSFHDRENLFLVMDFHPGGDLATQLARWGRLGRDRARFYAAEIVEGVEGLHASGVIYRDLKPENILIGADGHIVLTDFGLSKEFGARRQAPWGDHAAANAWEGGRGKDRDVTSTFCGTAEYLAPEVIQGLPYSYEVDWWSFGTMLYEMLTGITPFWANNHADMYVRVLQDELCFPDDKAMDLDTKSLIRGLLQRNPALRMTEPRIKKHPYFQMIDWSHVYHKRYIPPYIPPIDPSNESDTQNFDETFLDMEPIISDEPDESERERERHETGDTAEGETETDSVRTAGAMDSSVEEHDEGEPDLFDGYSYKGRHSLVLDEDEEESASVEEHGDATTSEGLRTSGTNTVDSRFTAESGVTVSTAPTSVEDEVAVPVEGAEVVKEEPVPVTESPVAIAADVPEPPAESVVPPEVALAQSEATTTAGPSKERTPEVVAAPLPVEPVAEPVTPAPVEVVAPAEVVSPKPIVTRRVEIRTPAEPTVTEAPLPMTPVKLPKTRFRPRGKEKSGVPALDRDLVPAEDEFDREDDDWDLVETPGGEEANGTKGTSLFARGVVDRYRLAVFRRPNSGRSSRTPSNSIFGPFGADTSDSLSGAASPTLSDSKVRRGRTGGLSLRKSTGQFLRPKSPISTVSASSSTATRASLASSGAVLSGTSTISRMTPPSSFLMNSPSLRPRSSAMSRESVGSPGSSDQSVDGGDGILSTPSESNTLPRGSSDRSIGSNGNRPTSPQLQEKHKNLKKMKKITEQGAEKVLALFHSQHQR